jgi:aubergine-like protein
MKIKNIRSPGPLFLAKKIWYDFFLVSQQTRQGTVTPIHINIIHDTIGLAAEKVQEITFKLTHLYYNWPGTVRVPAPVQYAHKYASLIGDSVHAGVEVAQEMRDKLFYL